MTENATDGIDDDDLLDDREVENEILPRAVRERVKRDERIYVDIEKRRAQKEHWLRWYDMLIHECMTVKEISRSVGITESKVRYGIDRVEKKLLDIMARRIARLKVRQTNFLELIQQEAMSAWRDSKKDRTTITRERGVAPGGEIDKVSEKVEGQTGNPAYLEQARSALADIRKIWGLDKHDPSIQIGSDGPIQINFVMTQPGDEYDRAAKVADAETDTDDHADEDVP
jgi:hypothetical protein